MFYSPALFLSPGHVNDFCNQISKNIKLFPFYVSLTVHYPALKKKKKRLKLDNFGIIFSY